MHEAEALLRGYLEKQRLGDCSCTLPYENLKYFKGLDLFSRAVVILSPENPYAQMCSLLWHDTRVEIVIPFDVLNGKVQAAETRLYVLLPPFPKGKNCPVTECLLHSMAERVRRHECELLASAETSPQLLQCLKKSSAESIERISPVAAEGTLQITGIWSRAERTKQNTRGPWLDENGEELEEEL